MNSKRRKKTLLLLLFLFITVISSVEGVVAQVRTVVPQNLTINTGTKTVGTMYYDNFYVNAKKITSKAGVGYCLELEKDYPHGESFKLIQDTDNVYDKVLNYGYPNVTPEQLGVDSEDDAYFATQVVVWIMYEGYDVNKIRVDNNKVLNAIKNIYTNVVKTKEQIVLQNTREYYLNDNIQRVVIYYKDTVDVLPQPPEDLEGPDIPPVIPDIPEVELPEEDDVNEVGKEEGALGK